MVGRRGRRVGLGAGAVLAMSGLVPGAAAGADIGVDDPIGGLQVPITDGSDGTGWLYDDTVTRMDHVRAVVGADAMLARGHTGAGVGVALVDTGVVPVPGLLSGNVVDGPDLSFESQAEDRRHLDSFGHGTHLAGIIAGEDPGSLLGLADEGFRGIAPGARLTSLKVASYDGAVDVSQVIAAIDWVVAHRNDDPRSPTRVLNLSYGTDGVQDYRVDPLTHAVENAWRAGIVVVAAGGNDGTSAPRLNNPAYDPFVLAVGAADTAGTQSTLDDTVPAFSSRGEEGRRVDVVAPGRSIASLRDPGSSIDEAHPSARVGEDLFKGSGSSQAAAVVSGAVALLLEQRPELTPDQVKQLLRTSAARLPEADAAGQGAGEIDLVRAGLAATPRVRQEWEPSTGTGSLEAARGTQHVGDRGAQLQGERHILGPWPQTWPAASASGTAWSGGTWNGRVWTGDCWCAATWAGPSWSPAPWQGASWSGAPWAGRSWPGHGWDGDSWIGHGWDGDSWIGHGWDGGAWSSLTAARDR